MVPVEELHDYARANAWRASEGLVFRIVGEPRIIAASTVVVVDGELENRGADPVEVIFFSGLHLRPLGDTLKPRTDLPPRPPPVPPPPSRIELAPGAREPFGASITLSDYTYASATTLEIEWTFGYWTGEKPTGRLTITLP